MRIRPQGCIYLLVCLIAVQISDAAGSEEQHRISIDEAREIGQLAIDSYHRGAALVPVEKQFVPSFYVFEAESPNPETAAVIGSFAVNAQTGDVWDMAGYCHHLTSRAIRDRQEELRRRFGYSKSEFAKLEKLKPMCDAD